MSEITPLIDFWANAFLNIFNCYRDHGGIFFWCTIALVVVYPISRRLIKSIRGGR